MAATLYPAGGALSFEELQAAQGIDVELVDDGSSYEELFSAEKGLVSVQHTLTLCAERSVAMPWLDAEFLTRCTVEGVVAHISEANGSELWVGWSEKFGFEQALRLERMTYLSGHTPHETPHIVLKLTSKDVKSAIV